MWRFGSLEGFFQGCISNSGVEVEELILRRYHDISYIMQMDAVDFIEFVRLAKEKELEEKIRMQWVVQLPFMGENYISFKEYFDKVTGRNVDLRSAEEIIKDIEEAHKG